MQQLNNIGPGQEICILRKVNNEFGIPGLINVDLSDIANLSSLRPVDLWR